MIEHIRKYSGLMIVVLVVVFISFFFMDTRSMQGAIGSPTVMKIDGRGYSDREFQRRGAASSELIMTTLQSGDFGFYQAFGPLMGRGFGGDQAPKQLFIGRVLLQEARDEFGIHPSEEEISSYIRKMRMFSTQDGTFDTDTYGTFVQRYLSRFGLTEHDLRELVSDAIVSTKLQAILGSGLGADRGTIARTLALDNQEIDLELARLDLDTYQDKIDPKEEEIKAYWEGIQDSFKTEPQRKFTYVLVSPPVVEEPAPEAPATPLPADATEEAKAAAKKTEDDKKAAAAAKLAEAKRASQNQVNLLVDQFILNLTTQKGAGFEELAKKNGWEAKTTEFFPQSKPPADLDMPLRASSSGGKAIDILYQMKITSDPLSKISPPIAVGEGQWLVARLDGEEGSRVKTYGEARSDARAQYISEKGIDALKAAAEQAATKIKEALAAGKSFEDAAKEAGITEIKKVAKVGKTHRPDALTEPQNLFDAARTVDPGTIGNTIIDSDRAFIVYVAKREVVKEPNAEARLDAEVKGQSGENQYAAFDAWLSEKIEAAKVQDLYTRR